MKTRLLIAVSLLLFSVVLIVAGCDKEKIVESTEYVKETQYVELPPDTVYQVDTVTVNDSTTTHIVDTIVQTTYVFDTVLVHDTVTTVQHHYDTTTITETDTVLMTQCDPSEASATTALHYHSDPLVIEFIDGEFGYTDGWIFYLSSNQHEITRVSAGVYDIYGYIDYWTPDWSGYYPLEFYWRLTYTGGDPSIPINWQMGEPPSSSPAQQPGLRVAPNQPETITSLAR